MAWYLAECVITGEMKLLLKTIHLAMYIEYRLPDSNMQGWKSQWPPWRLGDENVGCGVWV